MTASSVKPDQQSNTKPYPGIQVLLHWLSAAVIIWALGSAVYVLLFEAGTPLAGTIANFNVALSTLFIPLFVLRCYYRWRNPSIGGLAGWAHLAMYWVTGTVLLTGVLMMTRPIDLFGWVQIAQPLHDPVLLDAFNRVHMVASLLLAMLVVLHLAAVIWHELAGRRVLRRMRLG